jgi:hypothetical protein
MKRVINLRRQSLQLLFGAALFLSLTAVANVALAQEANTASHRVSVTRQSTAAERDQGQISDSTEDTFMALEVGDQQKGELRSVTQSKTTASLAQTPNTDFWFYSADVDLYLDRDADGYFYSIDLWFDADTYYDVADVYAVVYLSHEGGPWNEYAATDDFTLYGASSDDDYVIETDLMSGYPTGSYDLLVELFDSYDGAFVASIGPDDTSELGFLPLEDAERDAPVVVVREVIVREGGGSTGMLMLILLAALALAMPRHTPGKAK